MDGGDAGADSRRPDQHDDRPHLGWYLLATDVVGRRTGRCGGCGRRMGSVARWPDTRTLADCRVDHGCYRIRGSITSWRSISDLDRMATSFVGIRHSGNARACRASARCWQRMARDSRLCRAAGERAVIDRLLRCIRYGHSDSTPRLRVGDRGNDGHRCIEPPLGEPGGTTAYADHRYRDLGRAVFRHGIHSGFHGTRTDRCARPPAAQDSDVQHPQWHFQWRSLQPGYAGQGHSCQ